MKIIDYEITLNKNYKNHHKYTGFVYNGAMDRYVSPIAHFRRQDDYVLDKDSFTVDFVLKHKKLFKKEKNTKIFKIMFTGIDMCCEQVLKTVYIRALTKEKVEKVSLEILSVLPEFLTPSDLYIEIKINGEPFNINNHEI